MVKKLSGWVLAAGAGALLVACATEGSGGSYASFDPAQEQAGNTATERAGNTATERAGNTATERAPNFSEHACSNSSLLDILRAADGLCVAILSCGEAFQPEDEFDPETDGESEFEERRLTAWDGYLAVMRALPVMRPQAEGPDPEPFCGFAEACEADPNCGAGLSVCVSSDIVECFRGITALITCDASMLSLTEADIPPACLRVSEFIDD
ncbi:MAG: hypothetical protein KIT72_07755 [Polyangiaceae bacterium]|nr:hypothetical protein [Polyangiaceae bacterium]MCW5790299.1 hypothetical protein [Polyangiaceae bacterium]